MHNSLLTVLKPDQWLLADIVSLSVGLIRYLALLTINKPTLRQFYLSKRSIETFTSLVPKAHRRSALKCQPIAQFIAGFLAIYGMSGMVTSKVWMSEQLKSCSLVWVKIKWLNYNSTRGRSTNPQWALEINNPPITCLVSLIQK